MNARAVTRAPLLRALTLWQPWASLVLAGAKPYEFRSWPAPSWMIGKPLAIHAGARPVRRAEVVELMARLRGAQAWSAALRPELALPLLARVEAEPTILPLAHILCVVTVGAPVRGASVAGDFGGPAGAVDPLGRILNGSARAAHARWAWPLHDVTPLERPVPARGHLGFWTWRSEVAA